MVVLLRGFGNHSNRLFQALHYQAFCLEKAIRFENLCNKDLRVLYPALAQVPAPPFWLVVLGWFANWGLIKVHEPQTDDELAALSRRGLIFVAGWRFRCESITLKHQAHFSELYRVQHLNQAESDLDATISRWKSEGCQVVGVHIRRGDYSTFEGGRYFYDDSVYQSAMNSVRQVLSPMTRFVIFSNEQTSFESTVETAVSSARWHVDHHLMSRCDWLLGPPSTFTLWASYIGGVPVCHLHSSEEKVTRESFTVCHG